MGWDIKFKTLCEGKGNLLVNYQHKPPHKPRILEVTVALLSSGIRIIFSVTESCNLHKLGKCKLNKSPHVSAVARWR